MNSCQSINSFYSKFNQLQICTTMFFCDVNNIIWIDLIICFQPTRLWVCSKSTSEQITCLNICAIKYTKNTISSGNNSELEYEALKLIVVKKANIKQILANNLENDTNALGKGIFSLYKYVCAKYINMNRKDIEAFLIQQPNY